MKILLIYPYWLDERKNIEDVVVPPIGIYYVGAMLKENNYDVEILNWHHINKTPEKISSRTESALSPALKSIYRHHSECVRSYGCRQTGSGSAAAAASRW